MIETFWTLRVRLMWSTIASMSRNARKDRVIGKFLLAGSFMPGSRVEPP